MQKCMKCQEQFLGGERVVVKCIASYERFVDGMHKLYIEEEQTIVHEGCDDDD